MSIVSRHVKVSEKARQAITRDLTEVLGHADVQLLPSSSGLVGERSDQAKEADPVLTTEQAAQLVGVSRPFMAKLIDSGAVELHQKVGNQRRILRSAIVRWYADERSRQAKSLKRLATFMAQAFRTNDASYIAHALGVVARAKGIAHIAHQTGLSREQLYRSFSENGNPTLKTTLAVMSALGVEPTAKVPTAVYDGGKHAGLGPVKA